MRGGAPDVKSISSLGVLMVRGAHTGKRVEGRFHSRISKATKQNLSSHISGRRRDVDSMCTFRCLGCFRDVAGYLIGLHRRYWLVSFLGLMLDWRALKYSLQVRDLLLEQFNSIAKVDRVLDQFQVALQYCKLCFRNQ